MADSSPQVFGLQIGKFVEKAKAAPELVMRKAVTDMASRVVLRSPVDTGRFRANWNIAFGRINAATTVLTDKGGGITRGRIQAQMSNWQADSGDVFFTNSLPYAIPLEYGHSTKQAPQGMVRVTVTEWQSYVDGAVKGLAN